MVLDPVASTEVLTYAPRGVVETTAPEVNTTEPVETEAETTGGVTPPTTNEPRLPAAAEVAAAADPAAAGAEGRAAENLTDPGAESGRVVGVGVRTSPQSPEVCPRDKNCPRVPAKVDTQTEGAVAPQAAEDCQSPRRVLRVESPVKDKWGRGGTWPAGVTGVAV